MTSDELLELPVNDRVDRRLIRGRFVERPLPFRCPEHAAAVANLGNLLLNWQRTTDRGWKVFGACCAHRIERDPDTLLSYDASIIPSRLAPIDRWAPFVDGLPVLAAEVVDITDEAESVRELLQASVDAGVQVVWAVEPVMELIDEFRPGRAKPTTYVCGDVIDLGDVLPGFRCPVAAIFE